MNRLRILFCITLFYLVQISFCQTEAVSNETHLPVRDSVEKYQKIRQFGKVAPFAAQWVENLKTSKKENSPDYATALHSWGEALTRTAKPKEAEPVLLQALDLRKKLLGQNHPDAASTMVLLGILNSGAGKYTEAEAFYLQALDIRKNAFGDNHPDVAGSCNNLGNLYWYMALYEKAEPYYVQALEIRKKTLGESHADVATSLHNLGILFYSMGRYNEAEPHFVKALELRRKVLGEFHPDLASTMYNLGHVCTELGNYPKAGPLYLQALEIRKKAFGPDHPSVATSVHGLGVWYYNLNQYAKAEKFFLQALEVQKKSLGEAHPDFAALLSNLGSIYMELGYLRKAEKFYLQAFDIRKKVLGERHPDYTTSLHNLGILYFELGNYPKSESHYLQAIRNYKKAANKNHPDLAEVTGNVGLLHFAGKKMAIAETWYLDWNSKMKNQIQLFFPSLSDQEKARLYDSKLARIHNQFKAFCVERYAGKKSIAGDFFNDQLATKGLLLNSSVKWRHRIRTSGDTTVTRIFAEWETSQSHLNKLLQSGDSTELTVLDSVQAETEKLEKELSKRSESFSRLTDKKFVTWQEVQKSLKPGEAAVEIVRVRKVGNRKTLIDTVDGKSTVVKVKALTDTIYYAALVLKPGMKHPEMVLFKNGNDLEKKYLLYYQNAIKNKREDHESYKQFWKKLREKLGPCRRIYFSPDGVYHQINLNTLQNPETNKTLLEETNIHLITSTKDLLPSHENEDSRKLACLFGFPDFEAPFAAPQSLEPTRDKQRGTNRNFFLNLNPGLVTLNNLPGTEIEIERIRELLNRSGWQVQAMMRDKALEETLKESDRPKLLHIATHGYFQNDSTPTVNPLLKSGLFLSRAAQTLNGTMNPEAEDGILTAYEAMNLNLDNTDLVVLSACETGLGEIKNGEGVYGLQRAFKVAGARSIIMSLWKVDDDATQELMVRFYKHWLSPPAPKGGANTTPPLGVGGPGLRSAFLKAQKELKAKYPDPYYWGAFVMVGE